MLLDERERVADGSPMRLFDLGRDGRLGERPQRRHALHRGEREVIAGDRGCLWAGVFGDHGGQFALILRRPAVLGGEELGRHLGAYACPFAAWHRPVSGQACGRIEFGDSLGDLDPKRRDVVGVDLERGAQPGDRQIVAVGQIRALQLLLPLRGQGMQTDPEQRLHVLRCHRIANLQTVDAGQPGTNPNAGALTALGVVASEWDVALFGRI